MGRVRLAACGAAVVAMFLGAVSAMAQGEDERRRSAAMGTANELGILEFCEARGLVDAGAVAAARARQRAFAGGDAGAEEEALGRSGYLAFGGRQVRFDESAAAQGVSLGSACAGRAAVLGTGRGR